jgi:3-deoxy-D-manno-octulosonate 8-phosphate phosphatase (KDO 8-P phosphatase)
MDHPPSIPDPKTLLKIRLLVFDFDGVFTENGVWVNESGEEWVRCSRLDGMGIKQLRALNTIEMMVLSTEKNPVVSRRCEKLNLPCVQGCEDKGTRLRELMEEKGMTPEETAYVGNDINDAACLQIAGLPIIVADAHESVRSLARWITEQAGGQGAVREVCDVFLKAHES